jgi:galactokinase
MGTGSSKTELPRMASSDVSSGAPISSEKIASSSDNMKGGKLDEYGSEASPSATTNVIPVHAFREEPESIQGLIKDAKFLYESTFESRDNNGHRETCSVAPGRVNLIGEHVDYTGGFVLPLAIEYSTACYGKGQVSKGSKGSGSKVVLNLVSTMNPSNVAKLELDVDYSNDEMPLAPSSEKNMRWTNYITGVVAQYLHVLLEEDRTESSTVEVTLAVCSNVPLGGGLSSSASLEVAVALWLENTFGLDKPMSNFKVSPVDRALKCQKAEHDYANTPCGIMDQYIISAGHKNALLCIDCEDNSFETVQMPSTASDEICFIVTNSQVKHDNAGGEYPVRVQQCKDAKQLIEQAVGTKVANLRRVTIDMLQTTLDKNLFPNGKDDVLYKRAHHAVFENARVLACQEALSNGDWASVGKLMTESHRSMQHDYETSCEEIDFLVDAALRFDKEKNSGESSVYGTRLTGGGFGGCTVTLIKKEKSNDLIAYLKEQYNNEYNQECLSFDTTPADGVRVVDVLVI